MSEIFSLDGINYAKEVANPFPIGASIREEIKDRVYQNNNERVVQTVPQIARSRAYQICSASFIFSRTNII